MSERAGQAQHEALVLRERAERLAMPAEAEDRSDRTRLLLLSLGGEFYAVDVGQVREIIYDVRVARVPCAPAYVVGVISLRGEIISVCDLRRTLGLTTEPPLGSRPVIVVEVGEINSGIVADDVADIVEVASGAIEPVLATIDRTSAEYVAGEVTVDGKLVALLNLEHLIQPEEG